MQQHLFGIDFDVGRLHERENVSCCMYVDRPENELTAPISDSNSDRCDASIAMRLALNKTRQSLSASGAARRVNAVSMAAVGNLGLCLMHMYTMRQTACAGRLGTTNGRRLEL
jgi:hypothetical protein